MAETTPLAVWAVVELISRELQAKKDELRVAQDELRDAHTKLQSYWALDDVSEMSGLMGVLHSID